MPTKTEPKKETIKFDLFKTLVVIQSEKILSAIFTEAHGDDYKQHFICLENNMMNNDAKELIKSIFKRIISNDKKMLSKYEKVEVPTIIPQLEPVEELVVVPVEKIIPTVEYTKESTGKIIKPTVKKPAKPKKKKKIANKPANKIVVKEPDKPEKVKRRLSLAEIKARADARGGDFTENERALIACNDLKNIYVRIHNKGKYNLFTDEDARIVIATVDTVKKKLMPILNKK